MTQEDKSEKPSGFSLPDQSDEVTPQNLIFPQIAPLISAEFTSTIRVTLKSEEKENKGTKATLVSYAAYSVKQKFGDAFLYIIWAEKSWEKILNEPIECYPDNLILTSKYYSHNFTVYCATFWVHFWFESAYL